MSIANLAIGLSYSRPWAQFFPLQALTGWQITCYCFLLFICSHRIQLDCIHPVVKVASVQATPLPSTEKYYMTTQITAVRDN